MYSNYLSERHLYLNYLFPQTQSLNNVLLKFSNKINVEYIFDRVWSLVLKIYFFNAHIHQLHDRLIQQKNYHHHAPLSSSVLKRLSFELNQHLLFIRPCRKYLYLDYLITPLKYKYSI